MSTIMERIILSGAAETYNVEIPTYLAEALAFLAAATKYRTEVEQTAQPTLEGVTAKTIGKKIDAIIGAGDHVERLTLATRVETIANGDVETAYMRFAGVLLVELAKPFDEAAQKFMAVYDRAPDAAQDPALVAKLAELVRVRDQMAPGRVGDATPTNGALDLPSRCALLPCKDVIAVTIPARTRMLQRGSLEWLNAMLSVEGVRLKWHTPAQQAAHVASLPHSYPAKVSA
jgi:hypothetical protein